MTTRLRSLRLLIALAVMPLASHVLSPVLAQTASQADTEQRDRDRATKQEQRNAQQTDFRPRAVYDKYDADRRRASEQAATQDRKEQAEAQRQTVQVAWAQAIFGFVTMLLLIATLFYTARSANAAKKSADSAASALEATLSAALAATRSADAGERSLAQASQLFSVGARPWLVINPKAVVGIEMQIFNGDTVETHDGLVLTSTIKNVGQLPAKDMMVDVLVELVEPNQEPPWLEPSWDTKQKNTIAPGQGVVAKKLPITAHICDQVHARTVRVFMKVDVRYEDPFNGQHCQTTGIYQLELFTPWSEVAQGNESGINIRSWAVTMI